MSITPSTSKASRAYTVLPSLPTPATVDPAAERISLVLLNRDPWLFRAETLEVLHGFGFFEILSLEETPLKFDYEPLQQQFPEVGFVLVPPGLTPGEKINIAAQECRGDAFLVVWDDQRLSEAGLSARVLRFWRASSALAVLPERRNGLGQDLPSLMVPGFHGSRFTLLPLFAEAETARCLYPSDYTGLYRRSAFLLTGGFDPQIQHPFWQKVEWGLRCQLWGERVFLVRNFKLDYRATPPAEDQTPDLAYLRFYLRILAVRFTGDQALLPRSRFWGYWRRSGLPLGQALREFGQQRRWVEAHRYRYKTDAKLLVEAWDGGEE